MWRIFVIVINMLIKVLLTNIYSMSQTHKWSNFFAQIRF